jgi:membrane-bound lytic murein transglycosylase F
MLLACEQQISTNPDTASTKLEKTLESPIAESTPPELTLLEKIRQRGKLVVLTTNLPTTYYIDRDDEEAGPEYDMTQSFANSLELDVEYKLYDSIKELVTALRNNEGDIAAAGLTVNEKRKTEFDFGPVYQTTNEYLVCHRDKRKLKDSTELASFDIVVAADSSYVESIKKYPETNWTSVDGKSIADLIMQVADGSIDCTISDSTLYKIERRYYTEIQNKFTLSSKSELAWMLNKDNEELLEVIGQWFDTYKKDGSLSYMLEKYYGYVEIFDYVDTHKFLRRTRTRLPKYMDMFIDAANKNEIKPSLLAAQSYQESHWDRKAKSPTGVRGIMMLTQPVAKSLGVTNRLNAEQNIYAGAKFQAKMKSMVDHVDEPNRTWLALAAYNIGRGHFRDAQTLARQLNKNPDHWHDMKEVLPLLSKKEYYKNLRYGYARGNEPVRYVTRIRNYEELLHRHFDGVGH